MQAFFHGAVNTSAAPMLDVVGQAAPVVTQSQLLLSFKGSHVSGRNIIVPEGQNFVTQGPGMTNWKRMPDVPRPVGVRSFNARYRRLDK